MKNFDKHIDAIKEICENHKLDSVYLFNPTNSIKPSLKKDFVAIEYKNIRLSGYYENYLVFKNELDSLLLNENDAKESTSVLINLINDDL